jgi:glutathione S-transferase
LASPYQLTSVHISPFCELARWVLERRGIYYNEECHAPIWNVPYTKKAGQTVNVPVVEAPDATFTIAGFLTYIDARARADEKLYPSDPVQRAEMDVLIKYVLTDLAIAVRMYVYANMLPNRKVTGPLMTCKSPWWEKATVKLLYPLQAWAMRKVLLINPASVEKSRVQMIAAFKEISKRISGEGGFLFGDKLTMADLVFAAGTAPITLPPEYGAPFPSYEDSPPPMRATILAVQATEAGRLALRVYREFREAKYKAAETSLLAGDGAVDGLRWVTLTDSHGAATCRSDAIEALVKSSDADWVRKIVSETTASILASAKTYGRVDVCGSYARVAAARVVAEYLGVPGPTEHILMQWTRALYCDAYLTRGKVEFVRAAADRAAAELKDYLGGLIAARVSDGAHGEDILSRLVRAGTFDYATVQVLMTELLAGSIDNTTVAVVNAVQAKLGHYEARPGDYGMPGWYAKLVREVQVPTLVGAIEDLPNMKMGTGRFQEALYDGPMLDRFVVEFGAQ